MDYSAYYDQLDQILQQWLTPGYQMTDQDIANAGNFLALGQIISQLAGNDAQLSGYDAQRQHDQYQLQHDQMQRGYDTKNFDYQNRLLDFQMGPQMDYNLAQLETNKQLSQDDLAKAAEYLKQQQYGTEAASYNRDIARYQAMQALGLAAPDGLPRDNNLPFQRPSSYRQMTGY